MAKNEITYVGLAPIFKTERTEDGDLKVFGKATDESLDSDEQIVDLKWAAGAVTKWLETGGNLRVMHSASLYPAGIGIEVDIQDDGAYITGEVVEPTAKRLVEKGVLSAFSIGISHPKVVKDARAPNGRICGGEIVEISLVDRPANSACKFSLAKGIAGAEWVGEIEEIDADLQKEITADITKGQLEAAAEKESSATELDKLTDALEVIKGSRVFYTNDHKDNVQKAMATLHDSLAKAFPEVCNGMDKAEDETAVTKADDNEDEDKKPVDEAADESDDTNADEKDDDKKDEADKSADPKADDEEDAKDNADDEDKEKAVEPEEVKSEVVVGDKGPEVVAVPVTAEEDAPSLKDVMVELKKMRTENEKLQKMYDALASEPDPAQAPVRGGMATPMTRKVATPAAEAQKRAAEQDRAEEVEWLRSLAVGGIPAQASMAQQRLADMGEEYV